MPLNRLLLVDDDRSLSEIVTTSLREAGFVVTQAFDGKRGLEAFGREPFDAVLLDVLMPEIDGLDLCRRIRKVSAVPIVFLTSRAEEVDRITGLDLGADDYLSKPFSVRELVSRLRAIERRIAGPREPTDERLLVGELEIDLGRFETRWKSAVLSLTRTELLVLAALARSPGRVLSRDRLIDLARGGDAVITERTVDTFIKRIRAKAREVDASFEAIETVVGVGYRLKSP